MKCLSGLLVRVGPFLVSENAKSAFENTVEDVSVNVTSHYMHGSIYICSIYKNMSLWSSFAWFFLHII